MITLPDPLENQSDILRVAQNLLHESRARRVFPTPVDDIVRSAELAVDRGVDLSRADPGFAGGMLPAFLSATRKVLGIFDFREKVIYLDLNQPANRRRFVTLHETAHGALPWQRDLCLDDEETLATDVKEVFEREASVLASDLLFQLEIFEEEAAALPLTFKSPIALGRKFGASIQATARRYVERCPKRCAALVLDMKAVGPGGIGIRNFFASPSFNREFGPLAWPAICPSEHPFVHDALSNRRFVLGQFLSLPIGTEVVGFTYDLFTCPYYAFAFLYPCGERIASRTRIMFQ